MRQNGQYYMGLMSGTSMDGIDAALVDPISNQLVEALHYPYSESLRAQLLEAMAGTPKPIQVFNQLHSQIGIEFAQAALALLEKSGVQTQEVTAIGSHGQTLCHDANAELPYTVQLGCGHYIAEYTRIPVIADFRSRDLVAGGQGAPFAPLYHQALFKHLAPLAVVNIGGIANMSYLADEQNVQGYDVGPGNCLLDAWITEHQQQRYDKDGAWAAEGQILPALLKSFCKDPYFEKKPPKSLGKEYFSMTWLRERLPAKYAAQDVQATLVALTARGIGDSIRPIEATLKQVLICGGGVHNRCLIQAIAETLPQCEVRSTEAFGIHPDYLEAQMMAWLAEKTVTNSPVHLEAITGSKKPLVLGVIYPAGIDKSFKLEV